MRYVWHIFVLCSVYLSCANSQIDHDDSFSKLCEFHNSQFFKRPNGLQSDVGDKCIFKLPVSTANEKMARKFCNLYIPYIINKVVPGTDITECHAEATRICKSSWIQLYGRCYKVIKDLNSRSKAAAECKNMDDLNGKIAFLHRKELVRHWKGRFPFISHMWLDASEVITENLEINMGNHLLLAFEGYQFGVTNDHMLRVGDSVEAFSICEYTPKVTKAESNYLLWRYGEIYYPPVTTSQGTFMRTASARIGMSENDKMADHEYCARAFKPFISSVEAHSALPDREFIDKLLEKEEADVVRTSVRRHKDGNTGRNGESCRKEVLATYGFIPPNKDGSVVFKKSNEDVWMEGDPREWCDGASWSTGIPLAKSKEKGLTTMSDAMPAPIYCQARFGKVSYGDCDRGFTPFMRENGQKWCHGLFGSKVDYDGAQKLCQREHKAHLTGFTNHEELKLLEELRGPSPSDATERRRVWIGARRREECMKAEIHGVIPSWDRVEGRPCSRLHVFQWVNDVAPNPPFLLDYWPDEYGPNFSIRGDSLEYEKCLELYIGTHTVNDIFCSDRYYSMCGKEAPIIEVKPEF